MKVVITGAKGQLGQELVKVFDDEHEVTGIYKDDLDITAAGKVKDFISSIKPDLVIHCAAMTNVDGCEGDPDMAYKVNAFGTQNIAVACQKVDTEMVYVSTDFVFAGDKDEPYIEFDETGPLSVYGKSKLAGENYVRNLLNRYYIVRTAWLYGEGHNFVRTMLRLAEEKEYLEVVDDQVGTPTCAKELAIAISKLVGTDLYGTYHASNNGSCSWYEFARKIFELKGIDIEVKPITSDKLGRPARRPAYSVMRNFALESQGIYVMRDWEEALEEYLEKG